MEPGASPPGLPPRPEIPAAFAKKKLTDPYLVACTESYPFRNAFDKFVEIRSKTQHDMSCAAFYLDDRPVTFRLSKIRIEGIERRQGKRSRVLYKTIGYETITISLREATGLAPLELGKAYADDIAHTLTIKELIIAKYPKMRLGPVPKEYDNKTIQDGSEFLIMPDNGFLYSFPKRLAAWGRFLHRKTATFWDQPKTKQPNPLKRKTYEENTSVYVTTPPPSPSSFLNSEPTTIPDYGEEDPNSGVEQPPAKRAVSPQAPAPAPVPAPAPAPVVPLDLEEELKDVEARIDSVTLIDENERVGAYQVVLEELKREGSLTKDAPVVYLRQIPEICKLFKGWTSNNAIWKCIDTLFLGMTPAEYKSPKWQGLEKYYWKNDRGAGFVPITNQRKRVCDLDHPFAQHANPFCHPRFMIVCNRAMNDLWADKGVACRIGLGTNRQQMRAIGSEMKHMMAFMKKEKMFERIFADLEQHMPLLPPPALR